jgi:hypothetical protein
MTIPIDNSDFVPDAVLRCGPLLPGDATKVSDPVVLVEVLSPDRAQGIGPPSCVPISSCRRCSIA